jgi:two-component system repressor protein LuxO
MWIIEQEMIDRAMELTGGNVNKAASLLEISPSSVYRKRTVK